MANQSDPVSVPAVKPEVPAAVEAAAPAVTEAVESLAKAGWMASKAKIGMVVGGSLLTLVGGTYGIKLIGSGSPRAAAQQVAENKKEVEPPVKSEFDEPKKLPPKLIDIADLDAPPAIKPVNSEGNKAKPPAKIPSDLDLPDLKAPPIPGGNPLEISPPDVKVAPAPVIGGGKNEPIELPSNNKSTTIKPVEPTIIRVGAVDNKDKSETSSPPKAPIPDEPPLIVGPATVGGTPSPVPAPKSGTNPPPAPLKTDLDIPAPPLIAPSTGGNAPVISPPAITPPPAPAGVGTGAPIVTPPPAGPKDLIIDPTPIKPGEVTLPKTPGLTDPKVPSLTDPKVPSLTDPKVPSLTDPKVPGLTEPKVPGIDLPSPPDVRIKSPMIGTPSRDPGLAPEPTPMIGTTPKPAADAPKRDEYDEDWHTPRASDNYAMISKEYYKSADYAQALEAYNKDRRKGNESIVRVPPLWVLEEKFPEMIGTGKTAPKTMAGTPGKTTGLSFEPVEGRQIGTSAPPSRPAPAPVINTVSNLNDEYRVQPEAGETIREIARKVYGDPNAWKRIYDNNPSIDPTQPIPSGTTLRLPR